MFEPFLGWLYQQDLTDLGKLPVLVDLPHAPSEMTGYRRQGAEDAAATAPATSPTGSQTPRTRRKKSAPVAFSELGRQALAKDTKSRKKILDTHSYRTYPVSTYFVPFRGTRNPPLNFGSLAGFVLSGKVGSRWSEPISNLVGTASAFVCMPVTAVDTPPFNTRADICAGIYTPCYLSYILY